MSVSELPLRDSCETIFFLLSEGRVSSLEEVGSLEKCLRLPLDTFNFPLELIDVPAGKREQLSVVAVDSLVQLAELDKSFAMGSSGLPTLDFFGSGFSIIVNFLLV